MQQLDAQARRLLAAERFELLKSEAQPTGRVSGGLRRWLGHLLVAAGRRLAPDALSRPALSRDAAREVPTSE
jgi:hypothetical protein